MFTFPIKHQFEGLVFFSFSNSMINDALHDDIMTKVTRTLLIVTWVALKTGHTATY